MKLRITNLLLILFLIQACSSTKPMGATTDPGTRDGSSFENAVMVNSVSEEYAWVRENYPGSQMQMQALIFERKKPYDVLTFKLADGTTRKFHFDISKFYGKGF